MCVYPLHEQYYTGSDIFDTRTLASFAMQNSTLSFLPPRTRSVRLFQKQLPLPLVPIWRFVLSSSLLHTHLNRVSSRKTYATSPPLSFSPAELELTRAKHLSSMSRYVLKSHFSIHLLISKSGNRFEAPLWSTRGARTQPSRF